MTRRIVGPFNRVEGDLEVHLDIAGGEVRAAWVNSPLYRGFEQILDGKEPRDAMVYTPRICGICSVAQSMAAAAALAEAQGLKAPPNGELVRNLILAAENTADHLTHFYLFFMPDFARAIYAGEAWFEPVAARFKAMEGTGPHALLPARSEFMHIMGMLAGKWPHTLGIQPGGTTRAVGAQEVARLVAILSGFRRFLERETFGDTLETVVALDTGDALAAWAEGRPPFAGDLATFLHVSEALRLDRLGRATDRFMSYGAYRSGETALFAQGIVEAGDLRPFDARAITEDLSSSWLAHRNGPRHPSEGVTVPDADAPGGYSWCKAPRLGGKVFEVGALARQFVDGQPLVGDLVRASGGNVRNRVVARLVEVARLVLAMEGWARAIVPKEPFCTDADIPREAEGAGLIEAARGSLGHWLKIRNGRILNYQIVAPTTWNFSPRDGDGEPGACERALVGAPVRDGETDPVSVQHVVRSFDPCMVCTVH